MNFKEWIKEGKIDKEKKYKGCGVKEDKNGVYIHTHRARSKSYPDLKLIPDSVVKFIISIG